MTQSAANDSTYLPGFTLRDPAAHPIHSEPVLVIELDGIIAKKPEFDGDRTDKKALLEVKEGKMPPQCCH
jgi:hypothetical protein